MNEIPIEVAHERAIARVLRVLRAKLNDEARAMNAALPQALPLYEVPDQAIWRLGTQDDVVETMRVSGIGVFVSPDGAAELTESRTGSTAVYGRLDRSTWRVLCLFTRVGAYQAEVLDGVELRPSEMVAKMAALYKGALIRTLARYTIDSDNVHDLKVLDSYADYTPNENAELTGRAALTVEITQNVLMPQPVWGAVP